MNYIVQWIEHVDHSEVLQLQSFKVVPLQQGKYGIENWEHFKPKVKNQSHNYHSMKAYILEILNQQNFKS